MMHETLEIRAKKLSFWLMGVILLIAASLATVSALIAWLAYENAVQPAAPNRPEIPQIPAPPRLQVQPGEDLQALLTEKRARLNSYGWLDRPAGIAHIPIRRAMELMAQRNAAAPSSPASPSP